MNKSITDPETSAKLAADTKLHPESVSILEEIKRRAETEGMVLFVGAGINAHLVPLWKELLGRLLKSAIDEAAIDEPRIDKHSHPELSRWITSHFDVCAQASLIKQILGPKRYRTELREVLYGDCPDVNAAIERDFHARNSGQSGDVRFDSLWQVAHLCSCPGIRALATFNFDTLLEAAIKRLGKRVPRPHSGEAQMRITDAAGSKDLPIFHVHGRLLPPASLARDPQESVVFSYDEYFDKNADPLSWETTTPLHLLRSYCSLWLGASMTDWNMLRLLHAASSHPETSSIYCLQSLQESHELKGREELGMRFQATLFQAVGVKLAIAGAEYDDVWKVLGKYLTYPLLGTVNAFTKKQG